MSSNGVVKSNGKEGLTVDTLNANVVAAEYAVRGAIAIKAANYTKQLKSGQGNLPFDKVYACNIGNPQILGQKPMTFYRQVLSIIDYPDLLTNPNASAIYPPDVLSLAKKFVDNIPGGSGAYSESKGVAFLQRSTCQQT